MAKAYNLVADGNSITRGQAATPNSDVGGWPNQFRVAQNLADRLWVVKTTAVSGRTTTTCTAEIPNTLVPQFHRGYARNIVTFFEGVNDVVTNGANLATAQANWAAYVAAARATGFKVMCLTPLPTNNTGNGANVIMPQLAQWLRDNPSMSDFPLIDSAAHASLSNPSNTTFYQGDGLHLTNAGYGVLAGLVLNAVSGLA